MRFSGFKIQDIIMFFLLFGRVTPAGFKPATFGTGIRRSIQLSYGAVQHFLMENAAAKVVVFGRKWKEDAEKVLTALLLTA